jgi:signal transduction histidine kinase
MSEPALFDHLLLPIVNMLITSEALLREEYGTLTADQRENMETVHECAVETYTITREVLDRLKTAHEVALETLTHDWLTPSANIVSYADFMLEGITGDLLPDQTRKVQQIFYQAHYLRRQTYNLLDYAKIVTHDLRPLMVFALQDILKPDLVTMESPVEVLWDIPRDLPPVHSSKLYVARCISNLLSNAILYTEVGSIQVRALLAGRYIEISVSDTGKGISRRYWHDIFKPFFQIDPKTPGIGLGLYIAREFARLQQGSLGMESTPGQGSVFVLTVPTARE